MKNPLFRSSELYKKIVYYGVLLSLSFMLIPAHATEISYSDGARQQFNEGWKFSKGQKIDAEQPGYDDTSWEEVTLPHDWAIEGPFSPEYNARNGGLPFHGTGWYRKSFTLSPELQEKNITITFDGAMYNAHVYVNGKFVGNRPFGYLAFQYEIARHLHFDGKTKNVIAVTMSPKDLSTRWYPGAGLYRDVWIEVDNVVHISKWDTIVTTPEITKHKASVRVKAHINRHLPHISTQHSYKNIIVENKIRNANGKVVSSSKSALENISVNKHAVSDQTLTINAPELWDVNRPYLYTIETTVKVDGKPADTLTNPLGIRTVGFDANNGFELNGKRVQIQGVCLHHDNGPLGAVANRRAIERKLEIMKSMGVNSVRTSHNPPSPILVELADKMGILLQVESFDVWKIHKQAVVNSYNQYFDDWYETDQRDMVRHFRNNPSVIMWSIGNEIIEQSKQDGWKWAKRLTDITHDEDPTRLVAAGFNNANGAIKNKLAHQVDIVGLNYKPLNYGELKKRFPNWIFLASETSSITSTRGVYHFPLEKYKTHDSRHVTSFDIIGPPWAYPPEIEFKSLTENPHVMGEYMWTGFDYLGEPTPYGGRDHATDGYWNADWPVRSSSFGAVDLVGFPKDRYYMYQSQWTTEPMVHILPHWNWHGKEGEIIPVFAYTNADQVELFVNGKSMGKKTKGVDKPEIPIKFKRWDNKGEKSYKSAYRLKWDVAYTPGSIKAVAYKNGKEVAEKEIVTASHPYQIELIPDRKAITADGQDLSYITVNIKDKNGNFNPVADNMIRFFVEGAGEIAAVGNGDSSTLEPFKADYRRAFYGKAMLIVRSKAGQTGEIKIRAWADRLKGAETVLVSK